MKKMFLSVAVVLIAAVAFGQAKKAATVNYRVGLITSIPVDVYGNNPRIGIGSTYGEIVCKPAKSKQISYTLSSGYVKFTNQDNSANSIQIPVTVGARYTVNGTPASTQVYFGASAGSVFYNKKSAGADGFIFTPHVGVQVKKISVDARYINLSRPSTKLKTVALVLSYTL